MQRYKPQRQWLSTDEANSTQDICPTEFRRLLKTVLFRWDSAHCDFFVLMAPAISTLTYLLTYLLTYINSAEGCRYRLPGRRLPYLPKGHQHEIYLYSVASHIPLTTTDKGTCMFEYSANSDSEATWRSHRRKSIHCHNHYITKTLQNRPTINAKSEANVEVFNTLLHLQWCWYFADNSG